jgi:hypothetical protein
MLGIPKKAVRHIANTTLCALFFVVVFTGLEAGHAIGILDESRLIDWAAAVSFVVVLGWFIWTFRERWNNGDFFED